MKLGGFIVGGMVGAATVMYINSRRHGAGKGSSIVGQLMTGLAGSAMSGMLRKKSDSSHTAGGVSASNSGAKTKSSHSSSSDGESWEHIAALVNSDPAVKKETEKIMGETASGITAH